VTFFGVEIGRPQIFCGLLLLALALEAALASYKTPLSLEEVQVINRSVEVTVPQVRPERHNSELQNPEPQKDPVTDSILLYRVAALFKPELQAEIKAGQELQPDQPHAARLQRFLPALYRLPFLVFGLWLGGALWWVSRRLFNNEGGYVALALFCFSPLVIQASSTINAEIIAAWGLFGIVYTAIGVGHTLYSPPRRWPPRIVLLGLAFGFTAAAHMGAAMLGAALAVFFLLYLSPPDRKLAAAAVLLVAFLIACVFLWGCYGWSDSVFNLVPRSASGWLAHAGQPFPFNLPPRGILTPWLQLRNWPTVALFLLGLSVFFYWKRTRYFGNWTPLVVMVVLGLLQFPRTAPAVWIAPFVYVFVGGIASDLLESKYRRWTQILLFGLVAVQAVLALSLLR